MRRKWIRVELSKEDNRINNYESTHFRAIEHRATGLQPSISWAHSFSTWTQPSSLVRFSRWDCVPEGVCVRVKKCGKWCWVCEGQGSWEFPVRSEWAGQTSRIKPGLCSVALYMAPLLWPLSLSLCSFHTPFSNCLLLTRFAQCHLYLCCSCSSCWKSWRWDCG